MNVGELRVKLASLDSDLVVVISGCEGGPGGIKIVEHVALDRAYVDGDGTILTQVAILE